MKNPYKNCSDEELCNIINDITESKKEGKHVESFVPYAKELKDNMNAESELVSLSWAIDVAEQNFYDAVCERFLEKCRENSN
jgi:hypothetical protein